MHDEPIMLPADSNFLTGDEGDDHPELELNFAPKVLTSDLYHYTSSEAAILGILATRTIRMSPFQGTNDLWESRPLIPNLEGGFEGLPSDAYDYSKVWTDIDQFIRGYSKVACFTQDWEIAQRVIHPDALRGWGHLSLWAHYGAGHAGVCLKFDRARLIESFEKSRGGAIHQFYGPVRYRRAETGSGPYGISLAQAEEFGIDAVALRYAQVHRDRVFFRKHADWASESEFRLVRTDLSTEPFYFDITTALRGVVLGDAFPRDRVPALRAMLAGFDDVEVHQIRFHNRNLYLCPVDILEEAGRRTIPVPATISNISPRRSGDLTQRLSSLDEVERTAAIAREVATQLAAPVLRMWHDHLMNQSRLLENWTNMLTGDWGSSTSEIPSGQRQTRPGVRGDEIVYEGGVGTIAEQDPAYSFTWVAQIALQLRSDGSGVVHACISSEEWIDSGNKRQDLYRGQRDFSEQDFSVVARKALEEFIDEIPKARLKFDILRGLICRDIRAVD
ncbi:hypothetical protein QFZ52_002190 [Arthrobacter woluwensis]|uniref:DUF2971 domain-containing protein n=1 Tax=Arthrobacter woluwensis TaxID=156980 RepID=UPI00277EAE0C|nr:DUF2971 domain-containing protein [Arthrobacter woluwensis]MDQ0709538.1 hypothetical protein [Arthrobacter woluwensis]